jgi:hypothetical protein
MRKRFLILFLLVSAVVYGQTPAGYIKANMRFKWTAGIFDSALHVPQYSGTPSGIRNGAWVGDGAVAIDTVNNLFYFRSGGSWHSTSSGAGWLLTGNAGTTSSNFIGTTDNQPLSFRVNNRWAGRIYTNGSVYLGDSAGVNDVQENESNVGIGRFALKNVTGGSGNVASGESALYNLTVGFGNVAGGLETLYNLTAGSYNTASGTQALHHLTTGSNNVGIGTSSGNNAKQKVDAKNQILIGANTYGTRDSISVIGANFIKETIVRGKLIDSTLSAGAGTKAVRWNSSTGEFTYADTTAGGGGGSPAGSNRQVQYNNSGAFGGAAGVEIGNTNERLSIWQQSSSDVPLTIRTAGDNSKAAIEIKDTTSSPYTSAIKFTPSAGGNPQPSKIYQGYDGLYIDGGTAPYVAAEGSIVLFGNSTGSIAPFKIHTYPYDVPASPNNWVAKIRTSKTSAVGLAIDWGAVGQTGDLLQFRNNSNTVMARFDSIGKLGVNTVPVSYVDANGSLGAAITTTSSNITLDATHHTVIITSGTPTITLPAAASSNARRIYVVVNQTGSAVTISSYQNFSGTGTTTVAANSSIQIQSDGSNWYRIL